MKTVQFLYLRLICFEGIYSGVIAEIFLFPGNQFKSHGVYNIFLKRELNLFRAILVEKVKRETLIGKFLRNWFISLLRCMLYYLLTFHERLKPKTSF